MIVIQINYSDTGYLDRGGLFSDITLQKTELVNIELDI